MRSFIRDVVYYFKWVEAPYRFDSLLIGESGEFYYPEWGDVDWAVTVWMMNRISDQKTVVRCREFLATHGWREVTKERYYRLHCLK